MDELLVPLVLSIPKLLQALRRPMSLLFLKLTLNHCYKRRHYAPKNKSILR